MSKWLYTELRFHWNRLQDFDDKINLAQSIADYWLELNDDNGIIYSEYFNNPKLKLYLGNLIHDGNNDWSLLNNYISKARKEGTEWEKNLWRSCRKVLDSIRHAEVFIMYMEK
jgi:hypothetical protein